MLLSLLHLPRNNRKQTIKLAPLLALLLPARPLQQPAHIAARIARLEDAIGGLHRPAHAAELFQDFDFGVEVCTLVEWEAVRVEDAM